MKNFKNLFSGLLLLLFFLPVIAQPGTDLLSYRDSTGRERKIRTHRQWNKQRPLILASMQKVMGPLPERSKSAADYKVVEEAVAGGVHRWKITYGTPDGDRVPAFLMMPEDLKGVAPAVLCLHQTIKIGKSEPAGLGGSQNLDYAFELAKRGYVTLAPDYPNFGDYTFDAYSNGYVSTTMKGITNHMAAIDVLQSLPEVDDESIGCIGHSLGGHNSLFLAAFDTRIKVVVTSCGFNSFFKYMKGDLTGWSHKGYMPRIASMFDRDPAKMPFDFTGVLAVIAPRAIFISAPEGDNNFEVSGVRDCFKAALPVYRLFRAADKLVMINPPGGHDFSPEAREEAYRFMDRELGMKK